jgi:hypothetical protein
MSTRYLYWVDATIARADKASGAVEVLFRPPDGLTDFALLEPAVYWINESSVGRFDLDTRQNGVVVSNLFHREGYNDWPEVEANAKAVFVSSVMPSDPSFHGLYMRTLAEGDAGAPLVELDRRVGNRLVVTDRAVFYTRIVADGMTELAMICL